MDIGFDALLKAVDIIIILAIIGITEAVKRTMQNHWRWIPMVPVVLGIIGGIIVTPSLTNWRVAAKAAMLYAGAASIAFELLRTTILKQGSKTDTKIEAPKQ